MEDVCCAVLHFAVKFSPLMHGCCRMCCRPELSRLYVYLMVMLTVLSFLANVALDVVRSESLKVGIMTLLASCCW